MEDKHIYFKLSDLERRPNRAKTYCKLTSTSAHNEDIDKIFISALCVKLEDEYMSIVVSGSDYRSVRGAHENIHLHTSGKENLYIDMIDHPEGRRSGSDIIVSIDFFFARIEVEAEFAHRLPRDTVFRLTLSEQI